MTEQELNESLLKKIGFGRNGDFWTYPGKNLPYIETGNLPDLVHDPSACFKWLVPELRSEGINDIDFVYRVDGTCICFLSRDNDPKLYDGESDPDVCKTLESTALCQAANKFLR